MDKHINIVSFDLPWPADYGGAIEIFYCIKALHSIGVKVHLYSFYSDKTDPGPLTGLCAEIKIYKRKTGLKGLKFPLPYIVSSRRSRQLIVALQKNNYPILLEGIHSTHGFCQDLFQDRNVFVRLANVECRYYNALGKSEDNLLKKIYFFIESFLLRKYEKKIAKLLPVLALSTTDGNYYKEKFQAKNVHFFPAFTPSDEVTINEGTGTFCLYHGNLIISENETVVRWLCTNVFSQLKVPFIVAGKSPSEKLTMFLRTFSNVELRANPDEIEMKSLIRNAQIHVVPSNNRTGVKLKLLHAAFEGRHIVCNAAGVAGSGLENLVNVAETAPQFIEMISRLMTQNFNAALIKRRTKILLEKYCNADNAVKLSALLQ